jgi:ribonuclease BN (tRNA processing enzyme)
LPTVGAELEAVAQMARGGDVLVHETMLTPQVDAWFRDELAGSPPLLLQSAMAHMRADHSPAEEVGRVAQEAGVGTLVLSHLSPALDSISDDAWRAPAAKSFKGEIIVARDLMVV